jgi:cytoskeletal protein CcmA (bactofilin family)
MDEEVPERSFNDVPPFPKQRTNTVIAKGVTLSGSLCGQGVVEVEGTVEGELELEGSVVVTPTGLVTGPITADVVRIAGRVTGCITAREHLRLEKSGSVDGDVNTVSLVVEDGGSLNGRTAMLKSTTKSEFTDSANTLSLDNLQFGPDYNLSEEDTPTAGTKTSTTGTKKAN